MIGRVLIFLGIALIGLGVATLIVYLAVTNPGASGARAEATETQRLVDECAARGYYWAIDTRADNPTVYCGSTPGSINGGR